MSTCMLTVLGKDRPGIIAGVTGVLYQAGCNLEDVSMTILEGEFAMIMVVCLRHEREKKAIRTKLAAFERKGNLTFFWKELPGKLKRGEKHAAGSIPHLITVMGRDRTGIVYQTSRLLAKHRLNITDLNSRILGQQGPALYMMLLEVDIPRRFPLPRLTRDLTALGRKLGVELRIKPVERIEF